MLPLKDNIRSHSFPLVNWLIILANLAVFILVEARLSPFRLNQLVTHYGLIPARLTAGSPGAYATIFTAMFLHGGWLHVIGNLWALFIFGDNVEDRMGSGRYLVFYLLSGVAAAFLQVWISPRSTTPMIGASGAIAGVLAAYLVLFPHARVITLVPLFFFPWFIEVSALFYLAIWFVSQFFSGVLSAGVSGGVAYWAHVGGFVFGLATVKLFSRRHPVYVQRYPDEFHPW